MIQSRSMKPNFCLIRNGTNSMIWSNWLNHSSSKRSDLDNPQAVHGCSYLFWNLRLEPSIISLKEPELWSSSPSVFSVTRVIWISGCALSGAGDHRELSTDAINTPPPPPLTNNNKSGRKKMIVKSSLSIKAISVYLFIRNSSRVLKFSSLISIACFDAIFSFFMRLYLFNGSVSSETFWCGY